MSAGPLTVGRAEVRVGACSWTDPTLVRQTNWYPRRSMTAAERLAFYAERLAVVEVDSTYYFPPTPELVGGWVEASPEGFRMHVRAWSLLTGHPTFPHSLWPDLQAAVPAEHRDKRRLYTNHLPASAVEEAWHRFHHALRPLHAAGKLGAVHLQLPRWRGPKPASHDEIRAAAARLAPFPVCVELRNARWLAGDEAEATLELLEELGLAYVCVDEPQGLPSSIPPVVAATAELAVVRLHGRNETTWAPGAPGAPGARFRSHYGLDELEEWVPRIRELAASARAVHVLFNNCHRDDAVVNAAQMAQLLRGERPSPATGPPPPQWAQQRLKL